MRRSQVRLLFPAPFRSIRAPPMDPIAPEDLALLEMLQRIDQCRPLESGDTKIHQRLVDSGLATVAPDAPQLTAPGLERCQPRQHRVATRPPAATITEQR